MNFIIILVAVILLVIMFYFIFKFTSARANNPILLRDLVDGSSINNSVNEDGNNYPYKNIIDSSNIPHIENSLTFGYSFWIYIDNVGGSGNWETSYDKEKTIINRGDSPSINYIPKDNSLIVNIKTGEENVEKFVAYKSLRTQKWNHVCVILDNRNLDIYVDGKMIKSFILKEVPKLNTNDIYIFDSGNIYAELSYLRYFTMLLTPKDVEGIFKTTNFKEKVMSKIKTSNVYPVPTIFWWLLPWRNFIL